MKTLTRIAAAASAILISLNPAIAHADEIRALQWHLGVLKIDEAHQITRGEGVIVGLIDSGVDNTHPDLIGNIIPGTDLVVGGSGNGIGDADGHGTGMAGLIVSHGHGNRQANGTIGIAPGAKVLSIRLGTPAGNGTASDVARGIDWAVNHGATVICIANVGGTSVELFDAVERALSNDVVIVAGAGNRPESSGVGTPASFPGVVATAAVDRNGQHYEASVTGPELVIAAPGVDIVSTDRNHGYRSGTGTSDATAIVAGAVALVRAKYPNLSAEEVVHRLTATAIDKGAPGRDNEYGYGVLNLVAALTADIPPLNATTEPPTTAPTVPESPSNVGNNQGEDSTPSNSTLGTAVSILFLFTVIGGIFLIVSRMAKATQRD